MTFYVLHSTSKLGILKKKNMNTSLLCQIKSSKICNDTSKFSHNNVKHSKTKPMKKAM